MKQIKLNNVTLIQGDFDTEFESLQEQVQNLTSVVTELSEKINVDNKQDRLVTRKETSKILGGVSLTTLSNWAKSGLLVPHKIGGRVLYKESEILKNLNNDHIIDID